MDKHYDRDRIFQEDRRSDFLWCLHCERTYNRGQYRKVGDLQMCPYEDCDGDTVIDGWDWEEVREHHPDYPVIPEDAKVYPLYSEPAGQAETSQREPSKTSNIPAELSALFGLTIDTTAKYRDRKQRKVIQKTLRSGDEIVHRLKERIEEASSAAMTKLLRRQLVSETPFAVRSEVILISDTDFPNEEAFSTDVDVFSEEDDYDDVVAVVESDEAESVVVSAIQSAFADHIRESGLSSAVLVIEHELSGYGGG